MRRRSHRFALLVALATALALAACGGSDTGDAAGDTAEAPASPPAEPAPAPPPAGDAASVTAELAEFTITLSQSTIDPGSHTLAVENVGGVDHALKIDGPTEVETALIAPGGSAELSVALEEGSYEFYCPVPGHREQGMEIDVAVGGGGVTTEPPAATTGGDDDGGARY